MSRVYFDPFTPLGAHLPQSVLCLLQQIRVLYRTETDRDAPRVFDRVRASGHNVRGETPGGRTQDELECIWRVNRKTR